jgi:hypothetical protein
MKFSLGNSDLIKACEGKIQVKELVAQGFWAKPDTLQVIEVQDLNELQTLLLAGHDFTLSFPGYTDIDTAAPLDLFELKMHYPGYCNGL